MGNGDSTFAPAERSDTESIRRDSKLVKRELVAHVLDVMPDVVMVLNEQRQVVYANRRFFEFLTVSSGQTSFLGKRPGELFGCVHAHAHEADCGTGEFCLECGAVNAILSSQNERIGAEAECRITTISGKVLEFRVRATSCMLDDRDFTAFSMQDISSEKRREVLERIFFHDVGTQLFVILGTAELLGSETSQEDAADSMDIIRRAARRLTREIASQKRLLKAERGDLSVDVGDEVSSSALVDEVIRESAAAWPGRSLVKAEPFDDIIITTERELLYRVLQNMVKNAIEASSPPEVVSIRCTRAESFGLFSVHNPNTMPRSVQLQIFQRSFSTKGKGRGIGTYSMKLFGERYLKGRVWFSTSEDSGTTFFISVPLTP